MEKIVQKTAEKYIKERGRKKRWQKVVTAMAAVVVFCTTYALIMPAVTQQGQAFCGVEEHKEHTADCYETKQVLICTLSEEGHEHSSECFIEQPVLSCDILETDGHLHDESCYAEDGSLICEEIECEPHHHSDSCYTTEEICVCGLEEQPPHQHSEACYTTEETLVCELPIHEHSLQCFSDPEADIETSSVWERSFADITLSKNWSKDVLAIASTQIGYAESSRNYQVRDDGVTMDGYSRYGDWYGIPYGEWCAMFCSFCMHYAEVDPALMPIESGCQNWVEKLSAPALNLYHAANNERLLEQPAEEKYIPATGDLIFFDWDTYDPEHPENREADHVGFVAELIFDEATNEPTKIKTIEGNWNDEVCCNYYSVDDERILGYGELPENPEENYVTIESNPAADGAVAVISGNLPEGAEAVIEAVNLTQNELEGYFGVEKAAQMTGVVAYDIKIVVDGEEWQPDESVSVVVKQKVLTAAESESFAVAHVDDDTSEVADLSGKLGEDGEITFDTDGFSLYIFYTFTVDFHYDGLSFSINGMDSILLSDLFEQLGIEKNVSDVVSVTFSNPELLSVEQTEDGDWLLASLTAFSTDEALTAVFADGVQIIIGVTDAQPTATDVWQKVEYDSDLVQHGLYVIVSKQGSQMLGINGNSLSGPTNQAVTPVLASGNNYTFNGYQPKESEMFDLTESGSRYWMNLISNGYFLNVSGVTAFDYAASTVALNEHADLGGWTINGVSLSLVNSGDGFSAGAQALILTSGSRNLMTIYKLVPTTHDVALKSDGSLDIWYHDGKFYSTNVFTPDYEVTRVISNGLHEVDFEYIGHTASSNAQNSISDFLLNSTRSPNPTHDGKSFTLTMNVHMADTYEAASAETMVGNSSNNINIIRDGDFHGPLIEVNGETAGSSLTISSNTVITNGITNSNTADVGVLVKGDEASLYLQSTIRSAAAGLGTGIKVEDGGTVELKNATITNQTIGVEAESGYVRLNTSNNIASNTAGIALHNGAYLVKDAATYFSGSAIPAVQMYGYGACDGPDGTIFMRSGSVQLTAQDGNRFTFTDGDNAGAAFEYVYDDTPNESEVAANFPVLKTLGGIVYNDGSWYTSLREAVTDADKIKDGDTLIFFGDTSEYGSVEIQNSITVRGPLPAEKTLLEGAREMPESVKATWQQIENDVNSCITVAPGKTVVFGGERNAIELTLDGNNCGTVIRVSGTASAVELASKLTVTGGKGTGSYSGGVHIGAGGSALINGAAIAGNTATDGAGVYVEDGGTLNVRGGSITDNTATGHGNGVYQNGVMYISGAPSFGGNQDIYLTEGHVITKGGAITAKKIPVLLENEDRFRDILVSQTEDGCIVGENDMIAFDIKLSESASVTVDGALKYLGVVYSETGLDSAVSPANVLELDVSEVLIVKKVWNDNETTHPSVTVYLYKDGESEPLAERVISAETGWKATFTGLEANADGTMPYYVKESPIDNYVGSVSEIEHITGGKQAYWVPMNPNALSSGEFVIYGNSVALSHSGSTLAVASPVLTNQSIKLNGTTYSNYFTEDQITDNEIWTATGSSSTLITKDGYRLDYNSSAIRLNTSSTDAWAISSGMLRQGGNSSRNLIMPSLTVGSSGTAVQLYQRVLGDDIPAHYEVTITNRTVTYTSLIVNKQWSDGNANHENDTVDVTLVSSYGEDPVTKTLSAANDWSVTFEHLIEPAEGETLGYTLLEEDFPGYVSVVGDAVYTPGSDGQAWVPANNNTFVNGHSYLLYSGTATANSTGRLVRRTTNNGITGESVTLGGALSIGNRTYPTHIPVSQIPADTAYHAWTATASSSYFKLTNGGYYLRNQSTPIGSSTSNNDRLTMNNNHIRFYRSDSDDPYYYLRVTGATVDRTSSSSSASQFTLYELVGTGEATPGSYSITIQNKKIKVPSGGGTEFDPDMHKKIDYLGDGIINPDTNAAGDDLYRLYLDISTHSEPVDLLIVADCSNSMGYSFSGQTSGVAETNKRCYALDSTLNGTIIRAGTNTTNNPDGYYRNATRQTDGLIYQFLNANPENKVALIGYGNSTQIRSTWKTAANFGTTPESFYVNVQHTDPNLGTIASYTNYHLGLKNAKEQLLDQVKNDGRQKVVIFLTDGEPNRYWANGSTPSATVEDACEYASRYLTDYYVAEYPDLMFYVIGISKDATDPDTVQAIALKNMSEVYGNSDAYYPADTSDELKNSLMDIVYDLQLRPISIVDTLADYMSFADPQDFLITMSDPDGGNKIPLWNSRGAMPGNTLADGQQIIVSATANGKTGEVKFNEDLVLNTFKKFTVSYNVRLTGDPPAEALTVGAEGTDYDTDHITSSGKNGYNANALATVDYAHGQFVYRAEFKHPVVQTANYTLHLRKVDAQNTDLALAGAEFDLYVECGSSEAGCSPVPGMENTYWRKVNTTSLVSSATEDIVVENLRAGRYFLVETKAPDGHLLLQNPVVIELTADGVESSDDAVLLDEDDLFLACVKNTAGYELPETGGTGTLIYTLCGIAMMAAALMYGLSLRRKRERRYMK